MCGIYLVGLTRQKSFCVCYPVVIDNLFGCYNPAPLSCFPTIVSRIKRYKSKNSFEKILEQQNEKVSFDWSHQSRLSSRDSKVRIILTLHVA